MPIFLFMFTFKNTGNIILVIYKKEAVMNQKDQELALLYCNGCVKLDLKTYRCFTRSVLFFKMKQTTCKAKITDPYVWDYDLEKMVKYCKSHKENVPADIQQEIKRVSKIKNDSLAADIREIYYKEVHRDNLKFGGSSENEAPVSIKQKMKHNVLKIGWDERIRDQKKIDRLCSKVIIKPNK